MSAKHRLFAALCLWPAAAPADPVLADGGRALFAMHCAPCHGETATEGVGGDIRGMSAATVGRAVRGFEQMPRIDLTEAELAAIVAHLARLDGG